MNSAVVSYAQYGRGQGSQLAPSFPRGVDSRMSKRRRLDSPERYAPGAWDQQQPQQQQQGQPPLYGPPALNNISSFGSSNASSDFATPAAPGAPHDNAAAGGVSTLNDSSTSNANAQWHGPASSSYPDVSGYQQQPYFFGQTDPSTYNSPWPPADTTSTFGTQTSNYSIPAPSELNQVMPYFPPSRPSETSEPPFDANVSASLPNYSQDVEAAQPYRHSQSGDGHHRIQQNNAVAVRGPMSSSVYLEDASMHLKIQSLSILENLATQLIHTISKSSFPQIQEIMQNAHNPNNATASTNHSHETEEGQAYTTLKNLFDQTRKVYSRETPFIDAIAIQMFQPAQQEVIRKANIATFISSILGAYDVSFFHLNEFFMETFVPLGHRLLKWQGAIYLELKTQTYISALINSDSNPERMLDELFPGDLDAQILTRHPDAPSLSPSEQDFVDRCRARKNYLLAAQEADQGDAVRELPKKYQWTDFVREFASCITKNVDGIMNVPARSQPVFGDRDAAGRRGAAATQALHNTSNITGSRNAQQSYLNADPANAANSNTVNATVPSHSKSSSHSTNASHTIRQQWTKPEEDALLSGLAQVNGPHWSQILALYGRGGSVSEVLKDRNQVQLKDKARNLKLWYLKMGKDVPVALRGVTGELRKRGGARARAALGLTAGLEESGDGDDEGDEGEIEVADMRKGSTPVRKTKKR